MTDSVFQNGAVSVQVALAPNQLELPMKHIKNCLNEMLLVYSDDLEGVPVVYSDVAFPSGNAVGKCIAEHPWVHVNVTAKVLIFQPRCGVKLFGRVNKVANTHISLLVYGMFNASISADRLAESYIYNSEQLQWESDGVTAIADGSVIEFEILSCQHSHGVFFLEGGLSV